MSNWLYKQPEIGEEIVIFVNHSMPSYHVVKWQDVKSKNNDWDICLRHGVFVGPRNFKDGVQFSPDIKEKEFYWMSKKSFMNKIKI